MTNASEPISEAELLKGLERKPMTTDPAELVKLTNQCFDELCALHDYAGSPAWKGIIAKYLSLAAQQDVREAVSWDDIAKVLYESDPDNPRSWSDLHSAIENSKNFDRRAELIAESELYLTLANAVLKRLGAHEQNVGRSDGEGQSS